MMTNRERVLAVLDGKRPDRALDRPHPALVLRAPDRGRHARALQGHERAGDRQGLRSGDPARDGQVFKIATRAWRSSTRRCPEPFASASSPPTARSPTARSAREFLQGRSESGLPLEHPIQKREDYKVWEYVAEHTHYDPTYEAYLATRSRWATTATPWCRPATAPSTTSSSTWWATTTSSTT